MSLSERWSRATSVEGEGCTTSRNKKIKQMKQKCSNGQTNDRLCTYEELFKTSFLASMKIGRTLDEALGFSKRTKSELSVNMDG